MSNNANHCVAAYVLCNNYQEGGRAEKREGAPCELIAQGRGVTCKFLYGEREGLYLIFC